MSDTLSLNVLVIDDEESHASLVSRVFRKNGFDVAVSHSAEDGIAKLEGRDFDLVVTDIFMKGIGGIAGIDRIRASHPDVMIIAMSAGYSDMSAQEALTKAQEVGADAVLPKPFAIAGLMVAVSGLLDNRRGGG
ncbi:MAG: response regulator [Rhodospirillales bacterium]